ncbi:hypothetical protein OCK02_04105 (plasmid) [Rhizobium sp. TRM96647]|uniref:hypothetical protein n=1 Tax=unclassified Rhizobium TaxID=2613769 RepID=UPI0021E82834|nr:MULTISPECIES: hypothetical protein [unclassified Rhizobium]MCV3735377.1 hypothetical protein [Rhizobium sp. TRM96647]MCV3757860.1 hypothetical protein [Rhizobium sp. TRM96650]
MKRLFLILAMLAAMVSGWTPALAATQQAGMAAAHGAHDTQGSQVPGIAQHIGSVHGDGDHGDDLRADAGQASHPAHGEHRDGQKHGALHPLLCSACFAVVAGGVALPVTGAEAGATALPVAIFHGGEVLPPVPPPRPVRR